MEQEQVSQGLELGLVLDTPGGKVIAPHWEAFAHLNAALAAVMGDISPVEKGETNSFDKYKYVGVGNVFDAARWAMVKHGVFLHSRIVDLNQEVEGNKVRNYVEMEYLLVDGASGAMVLSRWQGEGVDSGLGDKGIQKATASANKYFLIRTFLIPTIDDKAADPDGYGEEQPNGRGKQGGKQTTKEDAPATTGNGTAPKPNWGRDRAAQDAIVALIKSYGVPEAEIGKVIYEALGASLEFYAAKNSLDSAKAKITEHLDGKGK
jgi:hypothetical protein